MSRRAGRRWRDSGLALLLLAPSGVVLGMFVIYPLVRAIFLDPDPRASWISPLISTTPEPAEE